MIFYLATYPRSGNSQLQSFIVRNFCFLASQVKAATSIIAPEDWDVQSAPLRELWPPSTLWDERTATYLRFARPDLEVSFDRNRRWRYYHSGPAPSPETRARLALEPDPFFIKTHHLPFDRYFEGEHVIHIRRHPGAVLWSYFRYQLDFVLSRSADRMFEAPPLTLDRIIAGDVQFGDWSAYHLAWNDAIEALGDRAMKIFYADMGSRPQDVLHQMAQFIGHPVQRFEVRDFKTYNSRFADKGLRGSDQDYEQFYTRPQLELMWRRHGEAARREGFADPNFDLAAPDDQISRLNKIVELSSQWGSTFDQERRELSRRLKRQAARRSGADEEAATTTETRREFGLREASCEPQLERLLALGHWLEDDLVAAVALSGMTSARIREVFPAGQTNIRPIPCASGLDLEADMADIFAASAALGSLQEEADFAAFMSLVEPGATVVDVGANFGLYAAHAALYAGPDGHVFAFEPGPGAFALLQANLERNGLEGRCTAEPAAVGASDGRAQFRLAADSAFSGLRDTGRSRTVGHIEVQVRALDRYKPLKKLAVDLIKIDTEGGEAEVLAGAHQVLARSPDVIVMFEFSHKNLDQQGRAALIAELGRLEAMGLRLYARGRNGGDPVPLRADELTDDRSENLYLVRPDSKAHANFLAIMRRPDRQPTPEQSTALEILRRIGGQTQIHSDLSRDVLAIASKALGDDLPAQPTAAVEMISQRAAATSRAQAELARLQLKFDELRAAHNASCERLEATFKNRDSHREASAKLADELKTIKADREQQKLKYDELRAIHHALCQRLDATFKSRDGHREASGKLAAELTQVKAERDQLTARVKALKQRLAALGSEIDSEISA